jgi:hypothetical protein
MAGGGKPLVTAITKWREGVAHVCSVGCNRPVGLLMPCCSYDLVGAKCPSMEKLNWLVKSDASNTN